MRKESKVVNAVVVVIMLFVMLQQRGVGIDLPSEREVKACRTLRVSMLFMVIGRCRAGIVSSSERKVETLRTLEVIMMFVMDAKWCGRVAVHALRGRLRATGVNSVAESA